MFKRFRVGENTNYTKVSNQFVRDNKLSLKAKGMLLMIMSLPEDWDFSVEGFVTIVKESKNTVYGILDELKERGYCRSIDVKQGNLKIDTDYEFYESPNEVAIQEYHQRLENKGVRIKNKTLDAFCSQSQLSCSRDSCSRELNTIKERLEQEKNKTIKEPFLRDGETPEVNKEKKESFSGRRDRRNRKSLGISRYMEENETPRREKPSAGEKEKNSAKRERENNSEYIYTPEERKSPKSPRNAYCEGFEEFIRTY